MHADATEVDVNAVAPRNENTHANAMKMDVLAKANVEYDMLICAVAVWCLSV